MGQSHYSDSYIYIYIYIYYLSVDFYATGTGWNEPDTRSRKQNSNSNSGRGWPQSQSQKVLFKVGTVRTYHIVCLHYIHDLYRTMRVECQQRLRRGVTYCVYYKCSNFHLSSQIRWCLFIYWPNYWSSMFKVYYYNMLYLQNQAHNVIAWFCNKNGALQKM